MIAGDIKEQGLSAEALIWAELQDFSDTFVSVITSGSALGRFNPDG